MTKNGNNKPPQIIDHNPSPKKYGHFLQLPPGIEWEECSYQFGLLKTTSLVPWELALEWLEKFNSVEPDMVAGDVAEHIKQRHLKPNNLAFVRGQMANGKWVRNADQIRFSCIPLFLMDGQHRLEAMVAEEKDLILDIVIGLEHHTFAHIDINSPRSASDILGSIGYTNPETLASSARLCINYIRGQFAALGQSQKRDISNWEIETFVRAEPILNELVTEAVHNYYNNELTDRLITARIQAGLTWVYMFEGHQKSLLDKFFDMVYSQLDVHSRYDPIFKLRAILKEHKQPGNFFSLSSRELVYMVVYALNEWLQANEIRKRKITGDMVAEWPGILPAGQVGRKPRKKKEAYEPAI